MLKTNSAGRKLYNKLRVSDAVILARNVLYPTTTDDGPIAGDDGTIKFLAIDEGPANTDADPRFYSIVTTEGPQPDWKTADHPLYTITHTPTKRPVDEIKTNATNEATIANAAIVPPSTATTDLVTVGAALLRNITGLTLTTDEQAALARVAAQAAAVASNATRLTEIHAQIDDGHEPDLTAGYTTTLDAPAS